MAENCVEKMKEIVISHMKEQEIAGTLSKAHSYDHVRNVSRYAGIFAKHFAEKLNVDPEKAKMYANMSGWSHDIVRYASQVNSGEEESAALLQSLYESKFSSLPKNDYERLVVSIVKNSDRTFKDMQEIYSDDPEALAVAMGLVVGDKLIETSGPRVLERRCFFIGERMNNPDDLGSALKFPKEAPEGVLSETFVRLGNVNHISNYSYDKAVLDIAQVLHAYQYELYKGILFQMNRSEENALSYILEKLSPNKKLAERVEKGGKRLVNERHLDGTYFNSNGLDILSKALSEMPSEPELSESSYHLSMNFATAKDPKEVTENWKLSEKKRHPDTYNRWMRDIIDYNEGNYAEKLLEKISDKK
jgi:hypothetical protein